MRPALLIVGFSLMVLSCDPCRNADCIPTYDTFEFNYLSEDSEDLLNGPTKKYDETGIEFYAVDENNNKTIVNFNIMTYAVSLSYVEVYLRSGNERCFFEINGVVRDTLEFKFNTRNTLCCGRVSTIAEIKLNGSVYTGDFPAVLVERD